MSGARILVVDDDPGILRAVSRALAGQGYDVRTAATAAEALPAVALGRPELVLLDLVLPDADGIDVCRAIRAASDVPIIVLSAVGDDARKVSALDEGADDYVTKPFSMDELGARIRVALRRRHGLARETALTSGVITLDVAAHAVTVGGQPVHLTPREFALLRYLMENEGRVLTQRQILATVWGAEYVDDSHILRTFVHQLRTRLDGAVFGAGASIVNDPGVGYRLSPAAL